VGAGQLARMMGDVAHDVNVSLTVLASSIDDSAVTTCDTALVGAADDATALDDLAALVDVVTFDHELVDLAQVAALEARGVAVRPSAHSLLYAVDKARQREALRDAGIAVPRFITVTAPGDPRVAPFIDEVGVPVVKAARGGYDGRGVLFPADRADALVMIDQLLATGEVLVEERLELQGELAQLLVRDLNANCVLYPLVTTVQSDGMCVEVSFPARVDDSVREAARGIGRVIADLVDAVGVVAIELFLTREGLVVNEIALRPHNSGHWTIEGAATSQFANHLLAVSGQSLGASDPLCRAAVMVNVVGAATPGSIDDARSVRGANVHDYGKSWRPGRKLGHVTAVGDDAQLAHVTAWESALAYGTNTRES
jgi:5-(carboxyamino)imidazole ribonucleotide synthase